MIAAHRWSALACAQLLIGCATLSVPGQPPSASYLPRNGPVCVGTGRADITPAPGVTTFGHGPDSRVSDGYWTRLYCRAFYIRQPLDGAESCATAPATPGADALVLVACELHSIDAVLQRRVALQVEGIVPASRLMMTAIHAHAAPAHYFAASAYEGLGSARLPGFDPALEEFLVTRISGAIRDARANARPAVLSWKHSENFWGFSRNRSLGPFLSNWGQPEPKPGQGGIGALDKLDLRQRLMLEQSIPERTNCEALDDPQLRASNPGCPELADPSMLAVDPSMHVLRIDAIDSNHRRLGPLGSISFFAMHPTVVSSNNRLLGADTHGVISRSVEAELRHEPTDPMLARGDPLHAVVNTNEGDMVPAWLTGDIAEAQAIGGRIGRLVYRSHPSVGDPGSVYADYRSTLGAIYTEVELRNAQVSDTPPPDQLCDDTSPNCDTARPRAETAKLCSEGEVGEAAVRGASDHRSSLAALPWFERTPTDAMRIGRSGSCQRPKRELLDALAFVTKPKNVLPSYVPLSLWQIDDALIAFLPAELTIAAGIQVRREIARAAAQSCSEPERPSVPIIAGLANAYIQYVATEREYQIQGYEGASTLYGPQSAKYFALTMRKLTRGLVGSPRGDETGSCLGLRENIPERDRVEKFEYDPGAARERMARPEHLRIGCDPKDHRRCTTGRSMLPRAHLDTCRVVTPFDKAGDAIPAFCMTWRDVGPGDVLVEQAPWIQLVDAERGEPVRLIPDDPHSVIDDRGDWFQTRAHNQSSVRAREDLKPRDGFVWTTLFTPDAAVWQRMCGAAEKWRLRVDGPTGSQIVQSDALDAATFERMPECDVDALRICVHGGSYEAVEP